jgi:hypothetical protein
MTDFNFGVADNGELEGSHTVDSVDCPPIETFTPGPLDEYAASNDGGGFTSRFYFGFRLTFAPGAVIESAVIALHQFQNAGLWTLRLPWDNDFLVDTDSPETIFAFREAAANANAQQITSGETNDEIEIDITEQLQEFIDAENYAAGNVAIFFGGPEPDSLNTFEGSASPTAQVAILTVTLEGRGRRDSQSLILGIHQSAV